MISKANNNKRGTQQLECNHKIGDLAPYPTSALPGSKEKVEVMTQRANLGYAIFHPLDATKEKG